VPEPLQSHSLDTEQLVLAVAADQLSSHLETTQVIENHQLLQLAPQRGEGLTTQADQFLTARNLTPRTVSAADDIQTLLALVAAGDGVALLPASVKHILPVGVTLLPLEGEHTQWHTGLAWNGHIKDPLRDKFLAMVMEDGQIN
jgi:DNA-binding transcriptional LysR family regulator